MSNFNPLAKTLAPLIKSSLNAYTARQEAIAQNISNVDSQGYKPLKVSFEENLQKALSKRNSILRKTHTRHIGINPNANQAVETLDLAQQNVNIENEMAELAKNQIRFDFATKVLARTYQDIRAAIIGRAG